jgi:hypothetical protein
MGLKNRLHNIFKLLLSRWQHTTHLYRGTTYLEALETAQNQAIDLERILVRQRLYAGTQRGFLYVTSQFATAAYYADLAGGQGRGLGPGIIKMEIPTKQFRAFARKYDITLDTPVSRPPFPEQTEIKIPYEAVDEFNQITRFSTVS